MENTTHNYKHGHYVIFNEQISKITSFTPEGVSLNGTLAINSELIKQGVLLPVPLSLPLIQRFGFMGKENGEFVYEYRSRTSSKGDKKEILRIRRIDNENYMVNDSYKKIKFVHELQDINDIFSPDAIYFEDEFPN